jgi:hypothetical protein
MTFTGIPFLYALGVLVAGAGILAAAHLLRSRFQVRKTATVIFWRELDIQKRHRILGGRFRHLYTFIFLLVIILLFAAAMLRPQIQSASSDNGKLHVIVDRGATMGIESPEGGSRLDAALEDLKPILLGAGQAEVRVSFVPCPQTGLSSVFKDKAAMVNFLTGLDIASDEGPSDLTDVIHQAVSGLRSEPDLNVVLLSDHPEDAARLFAAFSEIQDSSTDQDISTRFAVKSYASPVDNTAVLSGRLNIDANKENAAITITAGRWAGKDAALIVVITDNEGKRVISESLDLTAGRIEDFIINANSLLEADISTEYTLSFESDDEFTADQMPRRFRISDIFSGYIYRSSSDIPVPAGVFLEAQAFMVPAAAGSRADILFTADTESVKGSDRAVIFVDEGTPSQAGQKIYKQTDSSIVQDINFSRIRTGAGSSFGASVNGEPLLWSSDGQVLAYTGFYGQGRFVYLASALFGEGSNLYNDPVFPEFMARISAAVLNIEESFAGRKHFLSLNDHYWRADYCDLSSGFDEFSSSRPDSNAGFLNIDLPHVIIIILLILCLIEVFLYSRGRIV